MYMSRPNSIVCQSCVDKDQMKMKIDNLISSHDHLNPCLLFHNSYFHRFSPFPLLNHYIFFILFLSLVIPLNYDILFLCNIFSPSLYSSFSLSLLHFFSPSLLSSFSLSLLHFFSPSLLSSFSLSLFLFITFSLLHSFTPSLHSRSVKRQPWVLSGNLDLQLF